MSEALYQEATQVGRSNSHPACEPPEIPVLDGSKLDKELLWAFLERLRFSDRLGILLEDLLVSLRLLVHQPPRKQLFQCRRVGRPSEAVEFSGRQRGRLLQVGANDNLGDLRRGNRLKK